LSDYRASHLLPCDPAGVVLARRAVGELPLDRGRAGEVKLAVSELVTNSVEHAEQGPDALIELCATVDERGAVRVEVRDDGPGPPAGANHGLGWRIIDRVADRWGITRDGGRACVWFELDAPR
jgi:anti-sigma regulatory factor (Ser/Thr protein kinase)